MRQLFGEQQKGDWWPYISSFLIRGRKRASQTDKLGEHDRVFVCKGDLCSFVEKRANDLSLSTPPSERLGEQEWCWQVVRLQHLCDTGGLWWCSGTCTTLQLHLPFPTMKFCLKLGRDSGRWRTASLRSLPAQLCSALKPLFSLL